MTDITELVKRLRERSGQYDEYGWHSEIEIEAADALEAQAKEIKIYQQTELTYVTRVADAQREYSEMQAKLKARIAELKARDDAALRAATILAVSLAEKHWPENMDWRPLDETAGVITQINNMCAGLDARIAELEAALKNWDALIRHQYTGSCEAMSDMTVCAQETAKLLYGPGPWPIYTARAALKGET